MRVTGRKAGLDVLSAGTSTSQLAISAWSHVTPHAMHVTYSAAEAPTPYFVQISGAESPQGVVAGVVAVDVPEPEVPARGGALGPKMEELMEAKMRDRTESHVVVRLAHEIRRLTRANEEEERKIVASKEGTRVRELRRLLEEALSSASRGGGGGGGGSSGQTDQSKQQAAAPKESIAKPEEVKAKETRITMLETQMVDNARGFAKELSTLKMKVMEMDLGM